MDFLGFGTGEIVIVLIIAFLVFGPDKLVDVARTLGRLSTKVTNAGRDFTRSIQEEVDLAKESKELKELKEAGRELAEAVREETSSLSQEVKGAGRELIEVVKEETSSLAQEVKGAGRELAEVVREDTSSLSKEVKDAGREPPTPILEAPNLAAETKNGQPPEKQSLPAESASGGQPG